MLKERLKQINEILESDINLTKDLIKEAIIKEEFESINMDVLEDYPKKTLSNFIKRIYKIINEDI